MAEKSIGNKLEKGVQPDALLKCGLSGILTFVGCISLTVAFFMWKLNIYDYALCFFGASGLNKTLKIIADSVLNLRRGK